MPIFQLQFLLSSYPKGKSLVYAAAVCLALVLLTSTTPAVHADPHAVFYTATGQKQLFFNVLAALDQADYVEPQSDRQKLLEQRTTAGFGPETADTVTTTQTGLSGVVSRNITLEGHDLWTAYLTHQFALEVARRTATDQVLRVFCERGLGRPGCSNKPADQKLDQAFIVKPGEEFNKPEVAANAALQAGTSADQAIRQKIVAGQAPEEARPYDPFIAEARKQTSGDLEKSLAVERLAAAASNVGSNAINPHVYDDINIDSDGNVTSNAQTIDDFTNSLSAIQGQSLAYLTTKVNYQARAQAEQATTTKSGVKADTTIRPKGSKVQGEIKSIDTIVTAPVEVKKALIDAGADILGQESTNIAYAVPKGESIPGKQQLVERPLANSQGGQVQGITTSTSNAANSANTAVSKGKVAGILDNLSGLLSIFGFYDEPKQPLDPNVNPIAPIEESSSYLLTEALTSDTYRQNDPHNPASGFDLGVNAVRDAIFSYWDSIWCSISPTSCEQ